jgi:hypothetical protein
VKQEKLAYYNLTNKLGKIRNLAKLTSARGSRLASAFLPCAKLGGRVKKEIKNREWFMMQVRYEFAK